MEAPLGVHKGIPSKAYHSWDACSASELKVLFKKSAMHMNYQRSKPATGDALRLGQAYHDRVLLADLYSQLWMTRPVCDRRTKAGKAIYAEFAEKLSQRPNAQEVTQEESQMIEGFNKAVYEDQVSGPILREDGDNEVSVVWADKMTGLTCKARFDAVRPGMIVDLKGTKSAGKGFGNECAIYGYPIQACHYLAGAAAAWGGQRDFVFLAVDKTEPYGVGSYVFKGEDLLSFQPVYRRLLKQYAVCSETHEYPGYTSRLTPLNLPAYCIPEEVS